MKSQSIEILNAAFTPFFEDGSVNADRVPYLFDAAIQTAAKGVFLNGTTGECMSLSVAERCQLVEKWIAYRNLISHPDFKIIVHVGSCNLQEAVLMAEHAQQLGADGIAMVATFYIRPATLSALIEQCEYVASAVPETPFYYYNIPALTGVDFPLIDFMEVATKRIPSFAGLKNSHTNIVDYQHCIHFAKKKYAMYWGTDETFMMLYAAGNSHYVGSTYNYMGAIYHKMVEAYHSGNTTDAVSLQAEADRIYKIILQYNGIAAGKEIMKFIGIDCGPVRLPLGNFTKAESETLLQKLKDTSFFQYAPTITNNITRVESSKQLS